MRKGGLKGIKSRGDYKPRLAKRRALFPEGRGLGVGGKESKESKKERHWAGISGWTSTAR